MEDGTWENLAIGLVLFVLPVIFICAGAWLTWRARKFMAVAQRATGRVLHVQEHSSYSDGRHSISYKPTFEYTDAQGRTQRGETFLASSSYNYAIGEEREILVDPHNPDQIRMPGILIYGFGAIFMVVGTLFLAIGLFAGIGGEG